MRKYTKFILLIIIVSLVAVIFTACGKKTRKEIIGKWQVVSFETNPDTPSNLVTQLQAMAGKMVFAEGSVIEFIDGDKVSLMNIVTDYSWVTENKIRLGNEKNGESSYIFDVTIENDTMIFSNDMIIKFKKTDGIKNPGNQSASNTDNNKMNEELRMQIDALAQERDELIKQKSQLESKVKELESELKKYQEVVHKREFLTQDSQIEEKFALAYSLDETATIHELEVYLTNVTFSDNYRGVIPEFGKVVSGTINIKNIGRESIYPNIYTMYVVDNEGYKFKRSLFNEKNNVINEAGHSAVSYQIELQPKFPLTEEFFFIIPDIDTELLLELNYKDGAEVKYIRLK